MPKTETFPWPGLAGWIATAVPVIAYDTWAVVTGRPTMSRTLGHYLARPVVGPLLAGFGGALGYHLFIEELLPAFWAEQTARQDP